MEMSIEDMKGLCSENCTVLDAVIKADSIINREENKNIWISVSGGSDSDIMLDFIWRICEDKSKLHYVWFDTGLEYQATKDHINDLENKYGIEIERRKAVKPIPLSCREYGEPFLSKFVSKQISVLQKVGFKWEDKSYEELTKEYNNCDSALKWWCNTYAKKRFQINQNRYLKEFMVENPPIFKISSECCDYAKKKVSEGIEYDIMCIGVRKAEGGVRAEAYKSCFDEKDGKYRPLFWWKDEDKEWYKNKFGIEYSRCYTEYGFKRTGCVCCPYGKDLQKELKVTEKYEPRLYGAVCNVFKNSYEYTKAYWHYYNHKKFEFFMERGKKRE